MTPEEHREAARVLVDAESCDVEPETIASYLLYSQDRLWTSEDVARIHHLATTAIVDIGWPADPRSWDLPAEPDCALIDVDGNEWIPSGGHWDCPINEAYAVPWPQLICDYSPLTEAHAGVSTPPAGEEVGTDG